jgi:hypothetical protein
MSPASAGRLVILSGPSYVGKSPLARALARFYPGLHQRLQKLVLYNWEAFYYPLGDARQALRTFVDLLQGRVPSYAEVWEAGLLS